MKNALKWLTSLMIFVSLLSFKSVDVKFLPTALRITVIDELGNHVEGAKVTIFMTEEDYRSETNPVGESVLTNEKGVAKFSKLEPVAYYILAEKESKANHGAGVKTQALEEGKTNRVNTVIN